MAQELMKEEKDYTHPKQLEIIQIYDHILGHLFRPTTTKNE